MINLLSYSLEELPDTILQLLSENNNKGMFPAYRAKQLLEWVYNKGVKKFSEMTNIPVSLRDTLAEKIAIHPLELSDSFQSKDKEAIKYLFKTEDDKYIESVRIIHPERNTLCISSMVGCPLGCKFCATSYLDEKRNLSTAEIISQFLFLHHENPCQNVVFMGMGEPLLNTDNVLKAVGLLSEPRLLNFSKRRFTISTAGVISGIETIIKNNEKVHLAVSLNSPFQEERETIMPVTRSNPLKDLFGVLKKFNDKLGRFTFEYIVIPEVNNKKHHADAIIKLRKNLDFNLNVINFNGFEGSPFPGANREDVKKFLSFFQSSPVEAVERLSKGADIAAGCGQLAAGKVNQQF